MALASSATPSSINNAHSFITHSLIPLSKEKKYIKKRKVPPSLPPSSLPPLISFGYRYTVSTAINYIGPQ